MAQSFASSPDVRRRMQAQRVRDTGPELALRRALHGRGHRYRVDTAPLGGLRRRADLVFSRERVAVFVDGCFWHGCSLHGVRPRLDDHWYWPDKIQRNRERDQDTALRLQAHGWTVVRIWEHVPLADAVALVEEALTAARSRDLAVNATDASH